MPADHTEGMSFMDHIDVEVANMRSLHATLSIMADAAPGEFTDEEMQKAAVAVMEVSTRMAINLLAPTVANLLFDKGKDVAFKYMRSVQEDVLKAAAQTLSEAQAVSVFDAVIAGLKERLRSASAQKDTSGG